MTTVSVTAAGRVALLFEPEEAETLADLAGQTESLLTHTVDDPAFATLFPPAYRDDPAASAEFERFERAGLAEAKIEAARAVRAAASVGELGDGDPVEVELDQAEIWPWLTHLTDVRLVLAERLGIENDESEPEPNDELLLMLPLYDWLGWLQAALVEALEELSSRSA